MSVFSDEELAQWKDDLVNGREYPYGTSVKQLLALLARLNAAEKVITVGHTKACWTARGLACVCKWGDAVEAWKKSAGR